MRRLSSSITSCAIRVIAIISFALSFTYGQSSPHGAIKIPCINCHTTDSWKDLAKPMKFDHTTTGFTLQGAHSNAQCIQCHTTKRFTGTSTDCFKCHTVDFTKALVPNHQLGKFSRECLTCHTMTGWKPSVFQHSKTNFQLVGAHLSVDCASCHSNNRYSGLSQDCYSCHQKVFGQTISPNHKTGQFSHDCLTCHTINGWKPATFDHNKTNFRLVGAHAGVECSSCHTGGKFKSLPMDCFSCHNQDFIKTTQPNHATAQMSHDCLTCHTNISWKPSTFEHSKTNFQLVGAHTSTECSSCHTNGRFKGLPTDCYSCHQQSFVKTTTPNHSLAQFTHDCLTCHSTVAWKPSTFNHSATTFPLVGAHVSTTCVSCHTNGVFKGLPSDCFSCHQNNFNNTTNPNHATSQFSHDCLTCHSTTAWKPSTFNHASTSFPLLGAHAAVICSDCHKNGQYKGTSMVCYDCHVTAFNGTTTPSHVTSQFSHDCLTCHSNVAWKPATFNHSTTAFPLVGAHISATCVSCHKNGQYKGTSTDCFSCHQTDYTTSKNPAHTTANFPTACISCHTTTAWIPSTFNHATYFPIASGDVHPPGIWSTCTAECHTNTSNFKVFSCITCHQHDKTIMDSKHLGIVSGYVYDSNQCYRCHPKGRN